MNRLPKESNTMDIGASWDEERGKIILWTDQKSNRLPKALRVEPLIPHIY